MLSRLASTFSRPAFRVVAPRVINSGRSKANSTAPAMLLAAGVAGIHRASRLLDHRVSLPPLLSGVASTAVAHAGSGPDYKAIQAQIEAIIEDEDTYNPSVDNAPVFPSPRLSSGHLSAILPSLSFICLPSSLRNPSLSPPAAPSVIGLSGMQSWWWRHCSCAAPSRLALRWHMGQGRQKRWLGWRYDALQP